MTVNFVLTLYTVLSIILTEVNFICEEETDIYIIIYC